MAERKKALESAQRAIENFEKIIPQIRADLEALRERMGLSVPTGPHVVPVALSPISVNSPAPKSILSNKKVSPSRFGVNVLPEDFNLFGNSNQPSSRAQTKTPETFGNSSKVPQWKKEIEKMEKESEPTSKKSPLSSTPPTHPTIYNVNKEKEKIITNPLLPQLPNSTSKKYPLSSKPSTHPTIYNGNKKQILSKQPGSRELIEKPKDVKQLRQELFDQLQQLIDIHDKKYVFGNKEADLEKVRQKIQELLSLLQEKGEPTSNKEYLYDLYFDIFSSRQPVRFTGNSVKQEANAKAQKAKNIYNKKQIVNNSKTRKVNKKVSPSSLGPSYNFLNKGLGNAFVYNQNEESESEPQPQVKPMKTLKPEINVKTGLYVNPIGRKNIQKKMENKNINRQLQELEEEVLAEPIQNEKGDNIEQGTQAALQQGELTLAQAGIETPQVATPQSYDLILHPILQDYFEKIPIQSHKDIRATKMFKTLQTDTSEIGKQIFNSVQRFFQKSNIQTEAPETPLYKISIVNAHSIIRNGVLQIKPTILTQKEKDLYWILYNFSNNKLKPTTQPSSRLLQFGPTQTRGGKRTRKVKRSTKRKTRKYRR